MIHSTFKGIDFKTIGERFNLQATTPHFSDLTLDSIQTWLGEMGEPKYRAGQIHDWIFNKRVFDPSLFSNLSKTIREKLSQDFEWHMPEIIESHSSEDGATKLLINIGDKFKTEAVILRYENRTSLCVSSQVGCKLACSFCQTGKLGFFRHLDYSEIIAQFCLAQSIVEKEGRSISHIVFMGMGEPLDNYKNTVKAVQAFTSPDKFGKRVFAIDRHEFCAKLIVTRMKRDC